MNFSSHALDQLWKLAASRADANGDPSHDSLHVLRVTRNAERIGAEVGARMELLLPAALLHDVIHVPKNSPDRAKASSLAAEEAVKVLSQQGYAESQSRAIAQIVLEHSFSAGLKPTSLESSVLQDADRLDAIGAIGVVRAFTTGCKLHSLYYDFDDPFATGARVLDDKRFTLDHFKTKLLKLPGMMNTEPGRREAKNRLEFMREFLAQFESELGKGSDSFSQ